METLFQKSIKQRTFVVVNVVVALRLDGHTAIETGETILALARPPFLIVRLQALAMSTAAIVTALCKTKRNVKSKSIEHITTERTK